MWKFRMHILSNKNKFIDQNFAAFYPEVPVSDMVELGQVMDWRRIFFKRLPEPIWSWFKDTPLLLQVC